MMQVIEHESAMDSQISLPTEGVNKLAFSELNSKEKQKLKEVDNKT